MNPAIFKQRIFSQISTLLGTYKLGSEVPAIWIGLPDPKTVVSGLECLIPELPAKSYHGNQILSEDWIVTLTQYPGNDTLQQATRILRAFLRPCDVVYIPKPHTAGNVHDLPFLPQVMITYYNKEVLSIR